MIKAGQLPGSVLNVIKTGQTAVPMCIFPLKAKKWKTHVFAYVRARKLKMCFFPSFGEPLDGLIALGKAQNASYLMAPLFLFDISIIKESDKNHF